MIRLSDLEGAWQLSRDITDRQAGLAGRLDGTAVWRPDGTGLRQVEDGILHYGSAPPMRAQRVYLWRETADGLEILFEDGRPFHRLEAGTCGDRHLCDPDIYDVTYAFGDWPRWGTTWRVRVPRKNLIIRSRFAPLG